MPTGGVRKNSRRHTETTESFENWFDRELAEINADVARLEASLAPSPTVKVEPRQQAEAPARPAVKTPPVVAPAPTPVRTEPVAVAAAVTPVAPPLPTGTDLADPKNFGLMPPVEDLEQGTLSANEQRQRLSRHVAFATKVLHTSKVPAAVWREWRVFEKRAQDCLREVTTNQL